MALRKKILLHVIIWMIFICYELGFVVITARVHITLLPLLTFYLLNISLFYFNAHVLLDYTFFRTRRKYFYSGCLIILELIAYLAIKYALDNLLTGAVLNGRELVPISKIYLYQNLYRGGSFVGLSTAYFSTLYMMRFREKAYEHETAKLRESARNLELENQIFSVENAYLQNQISPHLLFNSLNFIHNTIYRISAVAGEGIMRLADLMRYSLVRAHDTGTVDLAQEVKQVENLLALCALRYPGQFHIRFRKKGRLTGRTIIPLVLITLVENMMKHGDIGDKENPAMISLEMYNDTIGIETYNRKRGSSLYPKNGLGLTNIEKRLRNHYREHYSMMISDSDEAFKVILKITL